LKLNSSMNSRPSKTRARYHPLGYTTIRMHFVYAVKHDGRHKLGFAGGHLTATPLSLYTLGCLLRSIRLILCSWAERPPTL
jgi:hypothetical protein